MGVLAPVHGGEPAVERARLGGDGQPVARGGPGGRRRGLVDHEELDLALERPEDVQRAVVGAVVDDDPAGGRQRLGRHGAHDALDVRALVADGRDDQDARGHRGFNAPRRSGLVWARAVARRVALGAAP